MKVLGKVVFTVWVMVLFGCQQADRINMELPGTFETLTENGSGIVELAYVPSEGFSYYDENGELTGVTIELFRDFVQFVEREYNVQIELKTHPIESFRTFYEYVRDSGPGIFGVANVTITEARKEELGFSPPYLTNIATLITHSDLDPVYDVDELSSNFAGLDFLAFEGTLHEERLRDLQNEYLPESEIHFAHSNREIIERTAEGNQYVAYVDIYNYWRAAEQGVPVTRHPVGDEASEQFGVILPLENDWQEVIVKFFEHDGGYIHSERYISIMKTHLGEELAVLLMEQNE